MLVKCDFCRYSDGTGAVKNCYNSGSESCDEAAKRYLQFCKSKNTTTNKTYNKNVNINKNRKNNKRH